MKKYKKSKNRLAKVVLYSIVFGLLILFLSQVALAFYIAKSENYEIAIEYLDLEPDKSIRSGF